MPFFQRDFEIYYSLIIIENYEEVAKETFIASLYFISNESLHQDI